MVEERRGNVGHESKNPYNERRKYPEPTICPKCGLLYSSGRWKVTDEQPAKANSELCPACRRIKDRYPGGIVYLNGDYLEEKEDEILNIVKNQEEEAKSQRPLQRIMWIEKDDKGIEIAVTNEHLARRIGKAVNDAQGGELSIKQSEGNKFVRVYWGRES